jgi:hypothetical protein
MSALRPLPPRPSLAFERKQAKALLRQLRAGDPDAVTRAGASHPTFDASAPERARLADAQLVIAREYGFASWPRLVRYFGDLERVAHALPSSGSLPPSPDFWNQVVRSLLTGHHERRPGAARAFSAYVPRFYGKPFDEVFAAEVTEAEARLATARTRGYPSWEALLERAAAEGGSQPSEGELDPMRPAREAIAAGDVDALRRVVEQHPQLLHPSGWDEAIGRTLMKTVAHHERRQGQANMRPIIEWLATQGLDYQEALNRQLCGHKFISVEKVRWLLDRGADPNWIAPSGIPVLEHAIIRYWNGAAVDVLAARVTPRRALWIAAGLGDVDGVAHFVDAHGRPTRAARRLRPDFAGVGDAVVPFHPDPGDEEILMEAFWVATLNVRTAVLEYLAKRGFNINSLVWGTPVLNTAAGNGWTTVVECLVRCGADPDLKGSHPDWSARDYARYMLEQQPENPERRRIAQLCGLDPDAILAEYHARPVTPPGGQHRPPGQTC